MRLALHFISFSQKFNKFNNTIARMLDSIYRMTLKLFLNHIFGVKMLGFCHMCDVISVISLCFQSVVY